MRVLVACEFSGVVRRAFRARGHDAWSCDLLPAEDGDNHHFQGDALEAIGEFNGYQFDLMIAHPPCTYLSLSGNRWRPERPLQTLDALQFAVALWTASIPQIALEQPRSILGTIIGKRTQELHPYEFGIPEFKTTWLWLKGLPPLRPTVILDPPSLGTKQHDEWSVVHRAAPGPDRWKERSRTYPEIAQAMAEQWGSPGHDLAESLTEPGYSLA